MRSARWRRSLWPGLCALAAAVSVAIVVGAGSAPARTYERAQVAPASPDLCPRSSRESPELAFGCSAIELVRHPALFIAPLLDELAQRRTLLSRERLLRSAAPEVDEIGETMLGAAKLFESGEICHGSQTFEQAVNRLDAVHASLARTIDLRAREIGAARAPSLRHRVEADVSRDGLAIGWMELEHALLGNTLADARTAGEALSRTCNAITGPLHVEGVVSETDDAAGVIRLRDGRVIGLAARKYKSPAAAGTHVVASGVTFADGTALADALHGPSANAGPPGGLAPCLELRIAPIQPMYPYHPGPATLHRPQAYRDASTALQLEYGMRLAVAQNPSCQTTASDGRSLFYGMKIDIYQGALSETLALQLADDGGSVAFPDFLQVANPTLALLVTTAYRTKCLILPGNNKLCDPPQKLMTTGYLIRVKPLGAYSYADYATNAFSVRDDGEAGDFESTEAQAFAVFTNLNVPATFEAQGYAVNGGVSSKPQIATIGEGQSFAVYEGDFYNPNVENVIDETLATGQEKPSALRWARVVGTRNGAQFWYSTTLPDIVRDLVATCPTSAGAVVQPGDPDPSKDPDDEYPTYPPKDPFAVPPVKDTYYKLPYADGTVLGHGYLNIDDANHPSRHPEHQAYALDLSAGFGTTVVATRGGIVRFLQETDPYTLGDPASLPPGALPAPVGWWGNGNKIYIEHEDGTYGVYYHFVLNSVLPVIGEHVRRGQALAQEGQTGGASGPHVHFQTAASYDPGNIGKEPWDVVRMRWEAEVVAGGAGAVFNPCYIPRNGDLFASTNPAPTPD